MERRIAVDDGLTLSVRDVRPRDDGGRLPVICLPGLSRNSRDFEPLARLLVADGDAPRRVVSIDSRGRGGSDWDPDPARYTLAVEAGDVVTVLAALGIDRAIVFGTSRGGLLVHLLPALAPGLLAGAILNDIGPVIGLDGLLAIAAVLTRPIRHPTWAEAALALRRTYGAEFPVLEAKDWEEMARCIFTETDDGLVPDFDPAIAAPLASLTHQTELADLWPAFETLADIPLLVLRGETSSLLSPETVAAMQARNRHMLAATIPGQGHVPLPHHPAVLGPLRAFLATLP